MKYVVDALLIMYFKVIFKRNAMIYNKDIYNHLTSLLQAATSLTIGSYQQRQAAAHFDVSHCQTHAKRLFGNVVPES